MDEFWRIIRAFEKIIIKKYSAVADLFLGFTFINNVSIFRFLVEQPTNRGVSSFLISCTCLFCNFLCCLSVKLS